MSLNGRIRGSRPAVGSRNPKVLRRASMIIADTGERIHGTEPPFLGTDDRFAYDTSSVSPTHDSNAEKKTGVNYTDVAKCVITYALASLFVFSRIGDIFADVGSKHQLATVGVYFHAARTVGNMLQALVFVFIMLLYALVISLASMLAAHMLYDERLFGFSYYLVMLLGFFGGSLGLIGYLKILVGNPTFDTACSVAIIALVINLIKEDDINQGILSLDQLVQYFALISAGVYITAAICFFVKPRYATTELKQDLMKLMSRYASMLNLVSQDFVYGQSTENNHAFINLQKQSNNIWSSINSVREHARLEILVLGGKPEETSLIDSLLESYSRLVTHLGGLTHCTSVVDQLLQSQEAAPHDEPGQSGILAALSRNQKASNPSSNPNSSSSGSESLFWKFVRLIEPPMNSLVATLTDVIKKVHFDDEGNLVYNKVHASSVKSAISLYSEARERSLEYLYDVHLSPYDPCASTEESTDSLTDEASFALADEAAVAVCGNFSYLLEDLGDEVLELLKLLDIYERQFQASWRLTWRDFKALVKSPLTLLPGPSSRNLAGPRTLKIWHSLDGRKEADDCSRVPRPFRYRLWSALRNLRQPRVRFAIKTAIGAVILAVPAFLDTTRPTFKHWRGEWALIVYMIMMARNLGAMTCNIPYRIYGTILGALIACGFSFLFEDNPVILWLCGILVSGVSFAWILAQNTPLGRFTLLTYNLVCLYGYSSSRHSGDPSERLRVIYDIAFHRSISVSIGVLWSVIVTLTILPNSARSTLRKELSLQWIRMGLIWKADPLATVPRKPSAPYDTSPVHTELRGISGEQVLQTAMLSLNTLLKNSQSEFRLRGTFDPAPYNKMLISTQIILDTLHGLNILFAKSPAPSSKEAELIALTKSETSDISSCLFIHFYTAASSIRLGFPVPERLPLPDRALERFLTELKRHRLSLQRKKKLVSSRPSSVPNSGVPNLESLVAAGPTPDDGQMEDFVLFYSYMLATLTITGQLKQITETLSNLYGTLYDDMFSL